MNVMKGVSLEVVYVEGLSSTWFCKVGRFCCEK